MSGKILTAEEYITRHKESFRAAFDFLNAHFPPGIGPEWWEQTAKDCGDASILNGENALVNCLLAGVLNYLESEWKLRRDENGQTEN